MTSRAPGTGEKTQDPPLLLRTVDTARRIHPETASAWNLLPPPTAMWLTRYVFAKTNLCR